MGELSNIEWTDATWNPWHGCHKVSPGCKNCYMFRDKARYGQDPNVVVRSKTTFNAPLKWKDPKMVFTCSWSDWFIEEADQWRDEAYEVIRATRHTYQILTKRIERAPGRIPNPPLQNIWLGVSVEDDRYKYRIDQLRYIPSAIRFLSLEPLLGDIGDLDLRGIDWVIVGGESGPNARQSDPNWFRKIRDRCVSSQVAFHFKQWGEWCDWDNLPEDTYRELDAAGEQPRSGMIRVGKKSAGRLLDGREWNQMPAILEERHA